MHLILFIQFNLYQPEQQEGSVADHEMRGEQFRGLKVNGMTPETGIHPSDKTLKKRSHFKNVHYTPDPARIGLIIFIHHRQVGCGGRKAIISFVL